MKGFPCSHSCQRSGLHSQTGVKSEWGWRVREGGAGGGSGCGEARLEGAVGGEWYVNTSQDGHRANNGNHVYEEEAEEKEGEVCVGFGCVCVFGVGGVGGVRRRRRGGSPTPPYFMSTAANQQMCSATVLTTCTRRLQSC